MDSLKDIAELLGRDRLVLLGLIKRFELPRFEGSGYPEVYVSFLRQIVFLRLAQIPEERILALWKMERKLMTLLHADSLGSPTWMIDGHGQQGKDGQRLFLSGYDVGTDLSSTAVQPGLDFSSPDKELFAAGEMGEDTLRQLQDYIDLRDPMLEAISRQEGILQAAALWARRGGR